jgi:outer membrane protein OmpA-like peptidoglycan-associated protein
MIARVLYYIYVISFSLLLLGLSIYSARAQEHFSQGYETPYKPMLTAPKKTSKPPEIIREIKPDTKIIKPAVKPVNLLQKKADNKTAAVVEENLEDKILEPQKADMAEQLVRVSPLNPSEKKILAGINSDLSKNTKIKNKQVLKDNPKIKTSSQKTEIIYPEKIQKPILGFKNYDLETVSIPFLEESTDLNNELATDIKNRIVPLLNKNIDWRVQIQAFSSESLTQNTNPRRLSLSRALKVREFLMENGIEPRRIDVRALGTETNKHPLDRVDLLLINPQQS